LPCVVAAQRAAGSAIAPHFSDRRVERAQTAAVGIQQPLKARHAVEVGADRGQVSVVQALRNPLVVAGAQLELPFHRQHLLAGGRQNLALALAPLVDRRRRHQYVERRQPPTSVAKRGDDELLGVAPLEIVLQLQRASARRQPASQSLLFHTDRE